MTKQTPQQRQNEKRRELPRLSQMFLSVQAMSKLDDLSLIHGSKKAAIEYLLLNSDSVTQITLCCYCCAILYSSTKEII